MGTKGKQERGNSGEALENEARRDEAMNLRIVGKTYKQIGIAMGYSEARAHKVVTKELARIREERAETINDVRDMELERLDHLFAIAMGRADPPETKDPDLLELQAENRMKAIDRAVKLMDRRAKLLGLDAPKRIDTSITNNPLSTASDEELDKLIDGNGED